MRRVAATAVIVGLVCLGAGTRVVKAAPDTPLAGVWKVEAGQAARAGLYMFTGTHYSMIAASTDRPDISDASKATADELRRFRVAGNTLSLTQVRNVRSPVEQGSTTTLTRVE